MIKTPLFVAFFMPDHWQLPSFVTHFMVNDYYIYAPVAGGATDGPDNRSYRYPTDRDPTK